MRSCCHVETTCAARSFAEFNQRSFITPPSVAVARYGSSRKELIGIDVMRRFTRPSEIDPNYFGPTHVKVNEALVRVMQDLHVRETTEKCEQRNVYHTFDSAVTSRNMYVSTLHDKRCSTYAADDVDWSSSECFAQLHE